MTGLHAGCRAYLGATGLLILALLGCSENETSVATERVRRAQSPDGTETVGRIRVVDLHGNPLAGMMPLATRQSNAFDDPVSRGPLTGEDGQSALALSARPDIEEYRLFIRAWDPAQQWFANNFFEVLPNIGDYAEEMTVTMARGAQLDMVLYAPDGARVANTNVGLMMFHPRRGPWWPDETDTDEQGGARFDSVPPGSFDLKLRAYRTGEIVIPDVMLEPGATVDLGSVRLDPIEEIQESP